MGLTLEEALTKHQISFKDAVTQMPRPLTDKAWSKQSRLPLQALSISH